MSITLKYRTLDWLRINFVITLLLTSINALSQNPYSTTEYLQNIKALNYSKGKDFKHWVNAIAMDDDGLLWISAYNILYSFDGTSITERAVVENQKNDIFNRMIVMNDTLYLFHHNTHVQYYPIYSNNSYIKKARWNKPITGYCTTDTGKHLLSTADGYVMEYIDGKFTTLFQSQDSLTDNNIRSGTQTLIIDSESPNHLWYFFRNNLYHINLINGSYEAYNCKREAGLNLTYEHPPGSYSAGLLQVEDNLYMGSYSNGLIRFHIPTKTWYSYSEDIPTEYIGKEDYINSVLSIAEYNDTLLLLGGTYTCFFDIKNKKAIQNIGTNTPYKLHRNGMSIKKRNEIITNNFVGGISILSDAYNRFVSPSSLNRDNFITNNYDKNKILWTSDGIHIYGLNENNDTIKTKDLFAEIGKDVSTNLVVDKDGSLWLGATSGLVKYNPITNLTTQYTKQYGLDDIDWIKDFSVSTNNDGLIIAQSGTHEVVFHIDSISSDQPTMQPYVSHVTILDEANHSYGHLQSELTLEPEQDFFKLHYSAQNYRNGPLIKYQYKIEGYDRDWITGDATYTATYNRLPPGNYNFLIKATNPDNQHAIISEKFPIRVKAHWYESLLFKIAMFILFLVVAYALYRIKTNALKREIKMQSQFKKELSQVKLEALRSQMNPHFLFNCLNSIDNFILSNDSQLASEYLGKFSKLIRNILDYSKTNAITLKEELEATELYIKMEQLRFSNKFNYEIQVDPRINQQLKAIPPLIIQPYVENSIWHGLMHKETIGTISISVHQEINYIIINIEDDGIGRKRAHEIKTKSATKRKSHGMKITEDRIGLIHQLSGQGGTVEVLDKVNNNNQASGTSVIIKLPFHDRS